MVVIITKVKTSKEKGYLKNQRWRKIGNISLTDGIFETGAYGVPSKSQNPIVLGQGGPSSTQCSNPSWATWFCVLCRNGG